MISFQKFKEIEQLRDVVEKHKAWLKDYEGEGIIFSKAEDGKHLMKWASEKKKYKIFATSINFIGRLPNRTRI